MEKQSRQTTTWESFVLRVTVQFRSTVNFSANSRLLMPLFKDFQKLSGTVLTQPCYCSFSYDIRRGIKLRKHRYDNPNARQQQEIQPGNLTKSIKEYKKEFRR